MYYVQSTVSICMYGLRSITYCGQITYVVRSAYGRLQIRNRPRNPFACRQRFFPNGEAGTAVRSITEDYCFECVYLIIVDELPSNPPNSSQIARFPAPALVHHQYHALSQISI